MTNASHCTVPASDPHHPERASHDDHYWKQTALDSKCAKTHQWWTWALTTPRSTQDILRFPQKAFLGWNVLFFWSDFRDLKQVLVPSFFPLALLFGPCLSSSHLSIIRHLIANDGGHGKQGPWSDKKWNPAIQCFSSAQTQCIWRLNQKVICIKAWK